MSLRGISDGLAQCDSCHPCRATNGEGRSGGRPIIAAVVAVAAPMVVVTVAVIHESFKKRTITDCVNSGENGMSVRDEKDKRTHILSGGVTVLNSGNRFALHGKKAKPKGVNKFVAWEVSKETKDFGACQPYAGTRWVLRDASIGFHVRRVSHMQQNHVSPDFTEDQDGHSSVRTTGAYTLFSDSFKGEIVEQLAPSWSHPQDLDSVAVRPKRS